MFGMGVISKEWAITSNILPLSSFFCVFFNSSFCFTVWCELSLSSASKPSASDSPRGVADALCQPEEGKQSAGKGHARAEYTVPKCCLAKQDWPVYGSLDVVGLQVLPTLVISKDWWWWKLKCNTIWRSVIDNSELLYWAVQQGRFFLISKMFLRNDIWGNKKKGVWNS